LQSPDRMFLCIFNLEAVFVTGRYVADFCSHEWYGFDFVDILMREEGVRLMFELFGGE
jgi:hypothetical protein